MKKLSTSLVYAILVLTLAFGLFAMPASAGFTVTKAPVRFTLSVSRHSASVTLCAGVGWTRVGAGRERI